MAVVERAKIYKGTRIPSPIATILQVDPALRDDEDILQVNFGPNHPSTHGVLRLVGDLNANASLRAQPHPLPPDLARNRSARDWGDLDALVHVPRARRGARPLRA